MIKSKLNLYYSTDDSPTNIHKQVFFYSQHDILKENYYLKKQNSELSQQLLFYQFKSVTLNEINNHQTKENKALLEEKLQLEKKHELLKGLIKEFLINGKMLQQKSLCLLDEFVTFQQQIFSEIIMESLIEQEQGFQEKIFQEEQLYQNYQFEELCNHIVGLYPENSDISSQESYNLQQMCLEFLEPNDNEDSRKTTENLENSEEQPTNNDNDKKRCKPRNRHRRQRKKPIDGLNNDLKNLSIIAKRWELRKTNKDKDLINLSAMAKHYQSKETPTEQNLTKIKLIIT